MKTKLFLLLALFITAKLQSQTILLSESFDSALFPPIGWSNQKLSGATLPGNWSRATAGVSPVQMPHTGLGEAKFNSFYYLPGTTGELVTSVVSLTDGLLHSVKFWMYRDGGNGNDKVDIYVNTTQTSVGGTLIGTVYRKNTLSPAETTPGWYQYSFTVPAAFNTSSNYFSFVGVSDYGFNIYIDDISIESVTPVMPGCIATFYPTDMATGICPNTTLTWENVDYATGYRLTLGNNPPNYNNIANNIDLGNTFSYSVLLSNSTSYRWKVRPYNDVGTALGCTIKSFTTASGVCYCTPDVFSSDCETEDYINSFSTTGGIANISNTNSGCTNNTDNYTFYSGQTVSAYIGSSFNVSMQSGPLYEQGFAVWIDWNRDGDFDDASEYAFNSGIATVDVVNGVVNVPATAAIGVTRMRVRCTYNYVFAAGESCMAYNEGETEDYNVSVLSCTPITFYQDLDSDGYGNALVTTSSCTMPAGYVANNTDCNDGNNAIHPGASELCNSLDDDCDLTVDEGVVFITYYQDFDADSYGNSGVTTSSCTGAPAGYVVDNTDCNDGNNAVHPGATELCNSIDDDCDLTIDEGAATATITASGPTTICKGTNLTLSANTGAGYTYQWIRNGSNLAGATSATYAVSKTGTYQAKVTVPGGCNATSSSISCTVNPSPNATISTPEGLDLCGLPDVDLVANSGTGYTYVWTRNGTVLDAATAQTYHATVTGTYKVKVTNPEGCTKQSKGKTVEASCRTSENSLKPELNLYPNPADELLNVVVSNFVDGEHIQIEVYDMLGNIVYSNSTDINGAMQIRIPVGEFAGGVYSVSVKSGETTLTQLVVIE